jgi:hypothetical protein
MARLQSLLKTFDEGKYVEKLNERLSSSREAVIAEMQARYDHLCGLNPQLEKSSS